MAVTATRMEVARCGPAWSTLIGQAITGLPNRIACHASQLRLAYSESSLVEMAFHRAEHETGMDTAVSMEPTWASPDDVERMQSALLQRMIRDCAVRHPWYSRLFDEHGIDPADVESVADLPALPLTSKSTFMENASAFRLEPDGGSPEDHIPADVTYTAGTSTGVPTPIYQTAYDLRGILFAQLRMAALRGLRRGDRVVNLYPLAPYPHGGWIRPTQAAATLGAPVVAATGGSDSGRFPIMRRMREVAELVVDTDPMVVWGIPSYVDRVLRHIGEQGGSVPSLRMIAVSGEPCTDARRASLIALAQVAGAADPFVSDSLGASELQFSLVECEGGRGFHNPAPELAHIEVVDDSGRPVPDGQPGRLAYTHLDRKGTVLLRFLVGDRAVLDRSACPSCGWIGGRLVSHLGREGNLIKVRGALINIDAAHAAVAESAGVVDHRIDIDTEDGMDAMTATIALAPGVDEDAAAASVVEAVRRATGVRPEVVLTGMEQIWSPDQRMKPARFVDHREETTQP
jgi:phenylacetate-coenzyme A ligase PaaK-like adenylate-forming protein